MSLPSWYRKIEGRVYNMIGRARVEKLTDGKLQTASMSTGPEEAYRDVERVQNYGFTSYPGPNGNGVALFLTGSKELPILVSVDHPLIRKKISEWEAAIYTKFGSHVHLKADGSIDILATQKLIMKSEGAQLDLGAELSIEVTKLAVKSGPNELISVLIGVVEDLIKLNAALVPTTGIAPSIKGELLASLPLTLAKLQTFKV